MKHFFHRIQGWFDFCDLYITMVESVKDSAHFVEIGCWKGASSSCMAVEIANSQKNIKFDCIDTWNGSDEEIHKTDLEIDNLYETFIKNMKPVEGFYNPIRMESVLAANRYQDNSLDFVFIDANHEYESVAADIDAWLPKVKIGGYLAGHDITFPSVYRAVSEKLTNFNVCSKTSWIIQKT